jgi:hypothetical protein
VKSARRQLPPTEPAPTEPVPFFQLDFDLACALKALADRGALKACVRAPDVSPWRLRRLRALGLVDLLESPRGGLGAAINAAGAAALPHALKAIIAGPGRAA